MDIATRKNASHTPGPWRIGPTLEEGNGIKTVMVLAGEDKTLWGVAKLGIVDTLRDAAEQSANATLITAAPDLLRELKNARTLINMLLPGEKMDALDRIDAAITKAEGRDETA